MLGTTPKHHFAFAPFYCAMPRVTEYLYIDHFLKTNVTQGQNKGFKMKTSQTSYQNSDPDTVFQTMALRDVHLILSIISA